MTTANDGKRAPRYPPTRIEWEWAQEMIELGWGLIANASHGDWAKEPWGWREAAERWREQYHKFIGCGGVLDEAAPVTKEQWDKLTKKQDDSSETRKDGK